MSDHYRGAGDGQCLAIKESNGERCTNGVYGSDDCCGTHKNASDVTLATEDSDRTWFRCPECGWQPADYEGPGSAPYCSYCSVEFPVDAERWEDGGGDEWNPQPAQLREGEHRDDDNTHASRNADQHAIADEVLGDPDDTDRDRATMSVYDGVRVMVAALGLLAALGVLTMGVL